MKEINVPQSYIDFVNKNLNTPFYKQLGHIFHKFGHDINSTNEFITIMRNHSNDELEKSIYNFLEVVEEDKKAFVYDLLIASKFSRSRLSEKLIEEVYNICNKQITPDLENSAWFFCDNLRELRQLRYWNDYVNILNIKKLGSARQPIVELISCSKHKDTIAVLLSHIEDDEINGHIFSALFKLKYKDINCLAERFVKDERGWVCKIAQKIEQQSGDG